ncbi:MAG: peroxisome- protein [Thelocarpon superellum]|nr:MAG: peroxisome- protein [Thelocarpon superellum]
MSAAPPPASDGGPTNAVSDASPATTAAFSPSSPARAPTNLNRRTTVLVRRKSPLLVATPPQITRALAYSHPFLLPLNHVAGVLSWTGGDAWESFLVIAVFWAVVLYGDVVVRLGGPVAIVGALILGMYSRRYSPLMSGSWPGAQAKVDGKSRDDAAEGKTQHQKSLDEIVETLNEFTSRCNLLLEPFRRLTEMLATQQSATSATTRPALTTLLIRILMLTPFWLILTLPPLQLITTRWVVLSLGTYALSWHSRPARVGRAILWRSMLFRQLCSTVTGLSFGDGPDPDLVTRSKAQNPSSPLQSRNVNDSAAAMAARKRLGSADVRFTFIIYENQRRWLGLGWTQSLFAYERTPWTDEHLNPSPSKDEFELPVVEGENAKWRWADGSEWQVEGAVDGEEGGGKAAKNEADPGVREGGWIYYDNKWRDGRRGLDGWGRYTRRRKWYRDAELVELTSTPSAQANDANSALQDSSTNPDITKDKDDSSASTGRKRSWFRGGGKNGGRRGSNNSNVSNTGNSNSHLNGNSNRNSSTEIEMGSSPPTGGEEDHPAVRLRQDRDGDWGVGDDAEMGLS